MSHYKLHQLKRRFDGLPIRLRSTGLLEDYLALSEEWDDELAQDLDEELTAFEETLIENPFSPVPDSAQVYQGDYHIANVMDGEEICMSFLRGRPNHSYHTCNFGTVGSGKSVLQGWMASQASDNCFTFLIDTSRTFREMTPMRQTHRFIDMQDLRLNPWDSVGGVPQNLSDAVVNSLIAKHAGLQYGEYELNEATGNLRKTGEPVNLPSMIDYLEAKRYPPGSRRTYYRDSAVLGLRNILNASGDGSIYICMY